MNAARIRESFIVLAAIAVLACAVAAAPLKVERTGRLAAAGASDILRQAVEDKGYRVTLDDGWVAEFWFAKELKTAKKEASGALYPELSNGGFVGVVNFPQGMSDYRGQGLPAGIYTLRYQTLPQDGNHLGVAPNPDFLLASPAADDSRPAEIYVYKKLIALSAKSTGTNHPAVIALESAGEPGTVAKDERGDVVFTVTVAVSSAGGASEKIGIVLKGTATQ
jgi:hypothetical protein